MYQAIMKLGSYALRKIMRELNFEPQEKYFANVAFLRNFLEELNYKGAITVKSITSYVDKLRDYVLPTAEATTADYILAKNLYDSETREKKKVVNKFYDKANEFINSISNTPLPQERWNLRDNKFVEKEGSRKFVIDFDEFSNTARKQIVKNLLERFWEPFLNKVTIEQKWIIKYYTEHGCYTSSIRADDIGKLKQYLENQNWDTIVEEDAPSESDSIIKVRFSKIRRLELIDYTEYPRLEKPKIKKADKTKGKLFMSYGKRNGRFWKWTLQLPKSLLNLERYQIFNVIDEETVKCMAKEHCLVYALQQFGIPKKITEDIKTYLSHCHTPVSKLNEIADAYNIAFNIRFYKDINAKPKYITITPVIKTDYTVNLLLYEHHYMLDEDINFNIRYIKLRKQMMENPLNTEDWTLKEKLRVDKFRGDRYTKIPENATPTCSLPELLKALFVNGYFKAISCNDYLVYCSSLYKEDLEESSVIDINKNNTRLIRDEVQMDIEKKLKDARKQLSELDPNEYDVHNIYDRLEKDSKKDKKHSYSLCVENGEINIYINERTVKPSFIIYADFECSTDGDKHREYCVCADMTDINNNFIQHFESYKENCAVEFLEWCLHGSLIYFHNLTYDMNFLLKHFDCVKGNPIIFNGRDMSYKVSYKGKILYIRDSYALISTKLEAFPSMFKLDSGVKEAFPYDYYTHARAIEGVGVIQDALQYVKPSLKQQFLNNIETLDVKLSETTFDMKKYAIFYCNQDVKILRQGMIKFRTDMMEALDLDCIDSISISSIADKYFKREIYYKNGNLYEVSGVLQKNLSKCVHGGRCMSCDNEKQINENGRAICDFDAVSLYPSAIARLYNLEGKPDTMPPEWDGDYILKHLFDEDQLDPTPDKFISGFFVKIHIDEIGKKRHFPLIVYNPALNPDMDPNIKRSSNTCCNMWCDHITLVDLIKFQKIKFTLLGGYYYSGKRDTSCRKVIQKLFKLRLKYKKEDNPLQQVIKLILNSVYGKTILKPIVYKHVFVKNENVEKYWVRNFNEITEAFAVDGGDLTRVKVIKPINTHFNFSPFGINILSMSKRIMNEVFCLAEDMGLSIFYQDTDSGHYYVDEIEKLATEYRKVYDRELIGKALGQFHSDFANVSKDGSMPVAVKSIFLGKKSYIDMLQDDTGAIGFHARMKGVTSNAIVNKANEMFPDAVQVEYRDGLYHPLENKGVSGDYSIYKLYEYLYNGNEVAFNLVDEYNPRFEMRKDKTIVSKGSFIRKIKF